MSKYTTAACASRSCRTSASSAVTVTISSQAPWSNTSCSVNVPAFPRLTGDPGELVVVDLPDPDAVVGDRLRNLRHQILLLWVPTTGLSTGRALQTAASAFPRGLVDEGRMAGAAGRRAVLAVAQPEP